MSFPYEQKRSGQVQIHLLRSPKWGTASCAFRGSLRQTSLTRQTSSEMSHCDRTKRGQLHHSVPHLQPSSSHFLVLMSQVRQIDKPSWPKKQVSRWLRLARRGAHAFFTRHSGCHSLISLWSKLPGKWENKGEQKEVAIPQDNGERGGGGGRCALRSF